MLVVAAAPAVRRGVADVLAADVHLRRLGVRVEAVDSVDAAADVVAAVDVGVIVVDDASANATRRLCELVRPQRPACVVAVLVAATDTPLARAALLLGATPVVKRPGARGLGATVADLLGGVDR